MNTEYFPENSRFGAAASTLSRRALAVGVVVLGGCIAGGMMNPEQFFRSYLLAFVFWNGIAVGSLAILMLQYLTGGAWGIAIRRELEAAARTTPWTALAFVPLLAGVRRLYVWANAEAVLHDELLRRKELYLNLPFFVVRAALSFGAWILLAYLLSRWSRAQDGVTDHEAIDRRLQLLSGGGLVVYALTTTFTSIDWVMSLEPRWYSTMYGVLYMVGYALSALAVATLAVILVSSFEPVSEFLGGRHRHDLGKMLFAITMMWAYVNFSQYLIIWSGNIPEEIAWYLARFRGGWGFVGFAIVVLHFVVPFLLLLSRRANRNPRLLLRAAALLVFMRFVDTAWLILPAFSRGAFRIHWLDLALPLGLGALWVVAFTRNLAAQPLLPSHDPGFEEALAHGRE